MGPDDPLALGIVDAFREKSIPVFGPAKAAAEIESSKAFAKTLMQKAGIPTAAFSSFSRYEDAREYLNRTALPVVVKASGLALGKGVLICRTREEAQAAIHAMMVEKTFGGAGETVVIEEYLAGEEVSIHALSDGKDFILFPPSQDHKAIGEGGTGPNTGGMGTVAPIEKVREEDLQTIREKIVAPALRGMARTGRTFTGCLYPGLKMTNEGPKVLEFNARFGDPETQSYMRLLKSDFMELIEACVHGTLASHAPVWRSGFAVCVVLASAGYPGKYEKGKVIEGISDAEKLEGVQVFHAGTTKQNGVLLAAGGRVLNVTAIGGTLQDALRRAYDAVGRIHFEGMQYRKDIGEKILAET